MNTFTSRLIFFAFYVFRAFILLCPRPAVLAMGRCLGRMAYLLDRRHRNIALSNLDTAFGKEKSRSQRLSIAQNCFRHYGEVLLDLLYLAGRDKEKWRGLITTEGKENLLSALEQGRGVLVFSAHYGIWEMASVILSSLGRFKAIVRPLDNIYAEKELVKLRNQLGAEIIYKFQASRQILRSLRANEIVAILIDLNVIRREAVFIDFFGKKAATTHALAKFHLRSQAAIIPWFCYPASDRRYHLKIMAPLSVPLTGDFDQDLLNITQVCTKIIEDQIRSIPEFWFWFHQRWKTRPPSSPPCAEEEVVQN